MEIEHSGSKPLTPEQQAIVAQYKERVARKAAQGGLTASDVTQLVKELRDHPEFSLELLQAVREEAKRLLPPGGRINFDWD
ncbi:hypothetical protein KQ302_12195 [Synechococcus sp. CS-602]|uniref:hypothetical protein n=1 Tax=Synechococcaceae TaxID=1890426 RepID=UPI0008FF62EC|nr:MULTISPECIES: hypothetical protein [Synechococcaceae]MCT4363981.1 hypothetical protein [Candidatus Regnicoccus frigidus MAG-AL1]APD48410.1 hypothetical protein BM449_09375 [Synechococcus sp. SynAce01]MCT0201301.1 hypothetical protein [Synechococcus sp. CS-603]MCT0205851.1 hypothetical protein [Synechococcus sp. CS-602]MCT0245957.1 hypothetical protein [Synechococcus sp. CS-601]